MEIRKEIENAILSEKTINKHVRKYSWISGSSTEVRPITIWKESVCVQLDTTRAVFQKAIDRVVEKNKTLFKSGSFCKNDGSCPATITFYLTKDTINRISEI